MLCAPPPGGNAFAPEYKTERRRAAYQGFTLLDVLFSKQELTVQIGKVDGVKIEQGNLPESDKNDVLDCKI